MYSLMVEAERVIVKKGLGFTFYKLWPKDFKILK